MKRNTYLAIACTLLVLAGGLYYFVREEPPAPPPEVQAASNDAAANVVFTGSSIVEQKNGKKFWELTAGTVEVNPNTKEARMSGVKGSFYRDNGVRIDLVANQAMYDPKTKDIILEGEIKATSSDGAVFTAAKARWAAQEEHFYGTGGIKVTRDDTVITGDAIDTDANIQKVKVTGNAHAIKGGTPE